MNASPSSPPKKHRRLLPDFSPLRGSRDFRIVYTAETISSVGAMATFVAIPYQVKVLTGSYVAVGSIGAVELVPLIVFGLWGGVLADAVDRKKMVLAMELAMMAASTLLLINAVLPHPSLWPLYVAAASLASFSALQSPSFDAVIPRVVPHEQLGAAASLSVTSRTAAGVIGPGLGGVAAATFGAQSCYAADVVSFVISLLLLVRLSKIETTRDAVRPSLAHLVAGLRFATSRRDLLGSYVVDLIAMIFAYPYALFPFVAHRFHQSWVLGALYAAIPLGAVLAALSSGWSERIHRFGVAIAISAAVWGLAIIGFGAAGNLALMLLALVIAGAADALSGVFRSRLWNSSIPDEFRGRLAGIELLSYSVGPSVGQMRSALVASATSLTTSIVSGGVLCVVGSLSALGVMRDFRVYDDRTDAATAAVRAARAAQQNLGGDSNS